MVSIWLQNIIDIQTIKIWLCSIQLVRRESHAFEYKLALTGKEDPSFTYLYIFSRYQKKLLGEPLSCAAKLNLKSCSCLFPKKTSIQSVFAWFLIWDANILAFTHSAKPKRENRESRWKEIRSRNYVYVFIAATILNWQTKCEGCSPPKKVKQTVAGAVKYQSRF